MPDEEKTVEAKPAEPAPEQEFETKTFQVLWKGKLEDVTIREMPYWEVRAIGARHTKVEYVGRIPQTKTDYEALSDDYFLSALVKAPFEKNLETVRNLPSRVGIKVFTEIQELNGLSEQKKET